MKNVTLIIMYHNIAEIKKKELIEIRKDVLFRFELKKKIEIL